MKIPLLILFSSVLAIAQPIGAGIKVGLPLTDFVNTVNAGAATTTNRYIIGPEVELRLPFGLGIEFDALYRHFNYTDITGSLNRIAGTSRTGDWEFPLLAKYRFPSHIVRPYVEGGVAWDTLSGISGSAGITDQHSTVMGGVIGAGIDIHALVIHISPELRYTRWTSQHFNVSNVLNSNQNQAEFLVGISF